MAFGFISALPNVVGIPALGATLLYLLFRAVKSMRTGSELSFQLQNFAVWLGMALGATAIGAFSTGTNFAAAFICWIVISVVGGMIVRFGPREEEAEDDVPRVKAGERPDATNLLSDPS